MNFARITTVVSFALLSSLLATPFSHAGESIMDIARNKQEKQIVINYLRARQIKHSRPGMTAEGIVEDLKKDAAINHALLLKRQQALRPGATGSADTAQNFENLIAMETDKLLQFHDKDVIIAMETLQAQKYSEADNYLFYIMNHGGPALGYLACTCGDPVISLVFAIFLVPLDLIAFPVEFFMSAFTGF